MKLALYFRYRKVNTKKKLFTIARNSLPGAIKDKFFGNEGKLPTQAGQAKPEMIILGVAKLRVHAPDIVKNIAPDQD